jgi:hypothetical protein
MLGGDRYQSTPSIAVSGNGNGVTAWYEGDPSSNGFIRAGLLLDDIWQTPISLSSTTTTHVITNPYVTMSSSDDALAVWIATNTAGTEYMVEWNLYTSGAWTNPASPIFQTSDFLGTIAASGNAAGQAFALWVDQTPFTLQGAVYDGVSWTVNSLIATDVFDTCTPPIDVSMNAQGDCLLLWANQSGGVSAIAYTGGVYASELFPGPNSTSTITAVSTALSDNGNGIALWASVDTTGTINSIYASFYSNGAWSSPALLDSVTGGASSTFFPNAGTDRNGNALAVWQKTLANGHSGIYYAISDSGSGTWTDLATLISSDPTSAAPYLSMNTSGNATVVWSITDSGPQTAQASYLLSSPFMPTPPINFAGSQSQNRLPWQTEFVNILHWEPSPTTGVASYTLYRNGLQIATISASSPLSYQDRDRIKGTVDTYQLTALNATGSASPPITITVP